MIRRVPLLLCVAALVAPSLTASELPEPGEIVDKMIAAAGGEGLAKLEVLRLEVSEEQTRDDGTSTKNTYAAYVNMPAFDNLRMELPGGVVLGRNGGDNWATDKGVFDERPQTPYMVTTTLNQTFFTLMMPYSLKMQGVWIDEVGEITWEGREAWTLLMPFAKGFFVSPVLTTTWRVVVDKSDYSIIAIDFLPSPEFRNVERRGMRYRILSYADVDGARIPSQILAVAINFEGNESGANKVTKIKSTAYGPWQAGLFLNPLRLEALETE